MRHKCSRSCRKMKFRYLSWSWPNIRHIANEYYSALACPDAIQATFESLFWPITNEMKKFACVSTFPSRWDANYKDWLRARSTEEPLSIKLFWKVLLWVLCSQSIVQMKLIYITFFYDMNFPSRRDANPIFWISVKMKIEINIKLSFYLKYSQSDQKTKKLM